MKLYEITKELQEIEEMYNLTYNEETGELIEEQYDIVKAKEDKMKELLSQKSDSIIKYIKNLDSDIKSLKEEEDRLSKLRKKIEKKKEWLKSYVMFNMSKLGYNRIETKYGIMFTKKTTSTIVDENVIPKDTRYWSTEITNKFDKNKIKKLLEEGEEIKGAYLQENTSLTVK